LNPLRLLPHDRGAVTRLRNARSAPVQPNIKPPTSHSGSLVRPTGCTRQETTMDPRSFLTLDTATPAAGGRAPKDLFGQVDGTVLVIRVGLNHRLAHQWQGPGAPAQQHQPHNGVQPARGGVQTKAGRPQTRWDKRQPARQGVEVAHSQGHHGLCDDDSSRVNREPQHQQRTAHQHQTGQQAQALIAPVCWARATPTPLTASAGSEVRPRYPPHTYTPPLRLPAMGAPVTASASVNTIVPPTSAWYS
jgi:hypothetical protein